MVAKRRNPIQTTPIKHVNDLELSSQVRLQSPEQAGRLPKNSGSGGQGYINSLTPDILDIIAQSVGFRYGQESEV